MNYNAPKKRTGLFTIFSLLLLSILSPTTEARDNTDDVLAELSLGDLLNLEISVATKIAMTLEEAPSIVSVITGDEIKNMGARNLMDVARIIPGFDFYHGSAVHSSASYIRGMSAVGKYKLLMNGHGMNSEAMGIFFDKFPVGNIRKIEIIRGPGSALYGAGAYLGVINIITKGERDESFRISFEGGSYNSLKSYTEFSYKKDHLKAYLFADYYDTDGYDGIVESDTATNSTDLASHAPNELTESGNHANIQTNISYKNFYFTGLFQKMNYEDPIGIANALTDRNKCGDIFAFGEIGYELPIKDRGHLLVKWYYDYHKFKREYEIFSYETGEMDMHTGFPPGEGLFGNPVYRNSVSGGEIAADYEVLSGINLVSGFSYEYWKVFDVEHHANFNLTGNTLEVNGIEYPGYPYQYFPGGMIDISEKGNWLEEADRSIMALYIQGIFDLKELFSFEKGVKRLTLTTGLRYDHYDDVGSSTNPRLGLVYAPTEKLWFKGLYGTAFRAPSWSEMYAKNNPASVGNGDVEPENVRVLELLMGYHFTEKIQSSVTLFHILAEDLIKGSQGTFKNVGEFESQGVEAEIKLVYDRFRYAYINATYQDIMNTTHKTIESNGGQIFTHGDFFSGNVPNFYGSIGVNRDFFDEQVIANLSMSYMAERKRSEEKVWVGEKLMNKDTRDAIDAYILLNTSLTFRNYIKGWEFQVSGFNLLNDDHRDPVAIVGVKNDLPRPGRTFTGRISYAF